MGRSKIGWSVSVAVLVCLAPLVPIGCRDDNEPNGPTECSVQGTCSPDGAPFADSEPSPEGESPDGESLPDAGTSPDRKSPDGESPDGESPDGEPPPDGTTDGTTHDATMHDSGELDALPDGLGPTDGGLCNAVSNAAPIVTVGSGMPIYGSGGTIVPGTYYLTTWTTYVGTLGRTMQATAVVGSGLLLAVENSGSVDAGQGLSVAYNFSLPVSDGGNDLNLTQTCGPATSVWNNLTVHAAFSGGNYTATSTTIMINSDDSDDDVYVFTLSSAID